MSCLAPLYLSLSLSLTCLISPNVDLELALSLETSTNIFLTSYRQLLTRKDFHVKLSLVRDA